MLWIYHGCVVPVAKLRVALEELLVAEVEQVALGVVQARVAVLVQVAVTEVIVRV